MPLLFFPKLVLACRDVAAPTQVFVLAFFPGQRRRLLAPPPALVVDRDIKRLVCVPRPTKKRMARFQPHVWSPGAFAPRGPVACKTRLAPSTLEELLEDIVILPVTVCKSWLPWGGTVPCVYRQKQQTACTSLLFLDANRILMTGTIPSMHRPESEWVSLDCLQMMLGCICRYLGMV